jgi:hypothetical protein
MVSPTFRHCFAACPHASISPRGAYAAPTFALLQTRLVLALVPPDLASSLSLALLAAPPRVRPNCILPLLLPAA